MRRVFPAAMLLLAACVAVRAEDPPPPPASKDPAPVMPTASQNGEPAPPEDGAHRSGPTIQDANDNMASLVESYIASHSKEGVFALKLGSKGPAREVLLQGLTPGSIKDLGAGRFSAVLTFRDRAGRDFDALALADFSGSDWRVTTITILPPAKKSRPNKKKPGISTR